MNYNVYFQEFNDRPNILRAIIGEVPKASVPCGATVEGLNLDKLVCLESNIDDMNPQLYAPAFSRLFDAGARDVSVTAALCETLTL